MENVVVGECLFMPFCNVKMPCVLDCFVSCDWLVFMATVARKSGSPFFELVHHR